MAPSKAVNRPVDPKQKEKDINTKLQLYGIYHAFKNGKLPSNKQCDVALNSSISSKYLTSPSKELSEEGRVLVQDLQDVIERAKLLFLTKNEGNLLQEFIWEARHISAGDVQRPGGPVDRDTAAQDAAQALEGLKTLGTLLITNGEFRKLLSDATVLLRDIAGDATQKAAGKLKPSEKDLAQIDQPAEDNVWHEKPNISKEDIKARFRAEAEKNKPANPKDVEDAANAATRAAIGDRDTAPISEVDFRAGGAAAAANLKDSVSQNVPEDAKARTNEWAQWTKGFLSSKMPPERRDQAIWRLKKMIVEIQGHSDYQQAVETLLTLAGRYGGHAKGMSQQSAKTVKGARVDDHLRAAEANLMILIERFANCTSTDDFFDSLDNIYRDADRDPTLRAWFRHMDAFIRKCLREQGFIMQEEANREWNDLYDQGHFLLRERYRGHTDRIIGEIKFLATQFDEDAHNKAFANSVEKLFADLGQDENGKAKFKKHLIKDITNVILPTIFENVRYIPIPRIEVTDPMVDVVVENIVIESDNLMPNVVELSTDNYWRWGRKSISYKSDHKVMISASGIQADMRDISYYVRKKQGFFSLTDTGIVDILLGGDGFSFKIYASTPRATERQGFLKVDKVSVNVKNLDIKLKESNHKLLFNLFKPMLFSVLRPAVEKVLEKEIRENFDQADAFIYQVHTEAKRADKVTSKDSENAPSIYSRYVDAFRKGIADKKQKAEAKHSDTKMQVTMTEHKSLKDIKLPGGITNKAIQYKELATKGERWESAIFDIGDATPSRNLPKSAKISRKPHNTVDSTLRDRDDQGTNGYSMPSGSQRNAGPGRERDFTKQVDQAFSTNGSTDLAASRNA